MKRVKSLFVLALVATLVVTITKLKAQQKGPRFERVSISDQPESQTISNFSVYHDKVTGNEFVCAIGHITSPANVPDSIALSCWNTGRKW